jgi:hypothetical protein
LQVISSDPMCDGLQNSGLVSGFVNTICIFSDAVVQQLFGTIMDDAWDGTTTVNPDGTSDDQYGPAAYAKGFGLLVGMYAISIASLKVIKMRMPKGK